MPRTDSPLENTRVVLATAPDARVAERLGRTLVQERLAACVNLLPGVRSIYRWKGELQEDSEVLLLVKTRKELLQALVHRLGDLHPYELPEVLALPVTGGSEPYLRWLRESVEVAE